MDVGLPLEGLPPETPQPTRTTLEKFQKNMRILLINEEILKQQRLNDKSNRELLKQLVDTKNLLLRITAAQRQVCTNLTLYLLESFPDKYPTKESIFREKKRDVSNKITNVPVNDSDKKDKKKKRKRKTPTPDDSEEEDDELDETYLFYMTKNGPFSPTYRGHIEDYQSYYSITKDKEPDDYHDIVLPKREESTIGAINKNSFMLHYGLLTPSQIKQVIFLQEENTRKKARKRTITSLPIYSNKKFRYKSYLPACVIDPPQLQPRKTRQSTVSARVSPARQARASEPSPFSEPAPYSSRPPTPAASPALKIHIETKEEPIDHSDSKEDPVYDSQTKEETIDDSETKEEPIDDSEIKQISEEGSYNEPEGKLHEDYEKSEKNLSSDDSDEEDIEETIPLLERRSKRQEERGNKKREIQKGSWEKYKKKEEEKIRKRKVKPQPSEDCIDSNGMPYSPIGDAFHSSGDRSPTGDVNDIGEGSPTGDGTDIGRHTPEDGSPTEDVGDVPHVSYHLSEDGDVTDTSLQSTGDGDPTDIQHKSTACGDKIDIHHQSPGDIDITCKQNQLDVTGKQTQSPGDSTETDKQHKLLKDEDITDIKHQPKVSGDSTDLRHEFMGDEDVIDILQQSRGAGDVIDIKHQSKGDGDVNDIQESIENEEVTDIQHQKPKSGDVTDIQHKSVGDEDDLSHLSHDQAGKNRNLETTEQLIVEPKEPSCESSFSHILLDDVEDNSKSGDHDLLTSANGGHDCSESSEQEKDNNILQSSEEVEGRPDAIQKVGDSVPKIDSSKREDISLHSIHHSDNFHESLKKDDNSCESIQKNYHSCDSIQKNDNSCDSIQNVDSLCESILPLAISPVDCILPTDDMTNSIQEVAIKPVENLCDAILPLEISPVKRSPDTSSPEQKN